MNGKLKFFTIPPVTTNGMEGEDEEDVEMSD